VVYVLYGYFNLGVRYDKDAGISSEWLSADEGYARYLCDYAWTSSHKVYNIPKRQMNSETSDDTLPVITNVPTAGDPELGAISVPSSARQLCSVWRAKRNNVTHLL